MFARLFPVVLPGVLAAALLVAAGAPQAQMRIASRSVVEFASVKQGREILGSVDDYVSRMGPFDRMLRLKTAHTVSEREFLDFATDNVLSWTTAEKARVGAIVASLAGELKKLDAPFPARVLLVKTTGRDIVDYWVLKLLVLEAADATGRMRAALRDGEPVLLAVSEVTGFSEQVGLNTGYIIHPEEILADNFALMVTGRSVKNPEVLGKLREVFARH